MTVNQPQAAYETIGAAASGRPCIVEVKQSPEIIMARHGAWIQALAMQFDRSRVVESTLDEQLLALP